MQVNVPMKITGAVDKKGLSDLYGSGVNIRQPFDRSNIIRAGADCREPGSRTSDNRTSGTEQCAPARTAVPQKRTRAMGNGVQLLKGQKWSLADSGGRMPHEIKICVGWDILDSRCQLDASAFMLCQNDKVPGDDYFIFYGQTASPEGSVRYCSNSENPAANDDAELYVRLDKVPPDIGKIAVCVTIYEAISMGLHFGMVENLYARILDERGIEKGMFLLKDCSPQVTAMVVGELYRYRDSWKFNAVGSGVNRDLSSFCGMYGVNIE